MKADVAGNSRGTASGRIYSRQAAQASLENQVLKPSSDGKLCVVVRQEGVLRIEAKHATEAKL